VDGGRRGPGSAGPPGLRQRLLAPVELLFTLLAGSRPVPGSHGTFLVACHRHHGAPVQLPDGTAVRRGEMVAEIHFWNRRLAAREHGAAGGITWRFARDFRADLGALARALEGGQLHGAVVAVYGASPLAPAAARFGFFIRPLPPGLRRSLLTAWQQGVRRAFRPRALPPDVGAASAELWMSRAELRRRYVSRPERHGAGPAEG